MKNTTKQIRSATRLYSVQALFQMEASDHTIDEVREQFIKHRFAALVEGNEMLSGDIDLFDTLIFTALQKQAEIDQATDRALVAKWPIDRIDPTLRAVFRAASAEIIDGQTPPKVVINEFIDIVKAFFLDGREVKLTNAVLDHIAKEIRPLEMEN